MQNEVIPPGLPGTNSFDAPNGTILFPRNEANETIVSNDCSTGYLVHILTFFLSQYEVTPIEYGSWQGRASAFAITKFAGTPLEGGVPVNQSACVEGFDTAIYILGSADSAANLCE